MALETPAVSAMEPEFELTDEQWNLIADLFIEHPVGPKGGRPRAAPRPCAEGILWILRTGPPWKHLPRHFPSPATCWHRLKTWTEAGSSANSLRYRFLFVLPMAFMEVR